MASQDGPDGERLPKQDRRVASSREALDAVLAGIQVGENTWERFVSTELNKL